MQTTLPQRAFAHSLRTLKRARGHPRQWPPAVMPDVPPPALAVAPVLPLSSGWAPPQGPSLSLPFRVRGRGAGAVWRARGAHAAAVALAALASSLPPAGSLTLPPPPPACAAQVSRTTKGNQIPVYTDFKNGRTRELTIVRRIEGDAAVLAKELYRVTGGAAMEVRPGRVEVAGGRAKEIKSWLAGLGF